MTTRKAMPHNGKPPPGRDPTALSAAEVLAWADGYDGRPAAPHRHRGLALFNENAPLSGAGAAGNPGGEASALCAEALFDWADRRLGRAPASARHPAASPDGLILLALRSAAELVP